MNFLKKIISALPLETLLGWAFPEIEQAIINVKANRTAETELALVESVLNAGAQEFDAPLLPKLQAVEATLTPLVEAGIAFEQAASIGTAKPLAASLLATAKIFVPNIPEEDAAKWLDATAVLLADAGIK